jgi:hypothetical protein
MLFNRLKQLMNLNKFNINRAKTDNWWAEIKTMQPSCTYYFGPFRDQEEAIAHQAGYIEDLKAEGNAEIQVEIRRCYPEFLTIEGDV